MWRYGAETARPTVIRMTPAVAQAKRVWLQDILFLGLTGAWQDGALIYHRAGRRAARRLHADRERHGADHVFFQLRRQRDRKFALRRQKPERTRRGAKFGCRLPAAHLPPVAGYVRCAKSRQTVSRWSLHKAARRRCGLVPPRRPAAHSAVSPRLCYHSAYCGTRPIPVGVR